MASLQKKPITKLNTCRHLSLIPTNKMKVKVELLPENFQPYQVTIKIESQEEEVAFYTLLNTAKPFKVSDDLKMDMNYMADTIKDEIKAATNPCSESDQKEKELLTSEDQMKTRNAGEGGEIE